MGIVLLICFLLSVAFIELWYRLISFTMKKYCVKEVEHLQYCKYVLVLGTKKWAGQHINAYFKYRLQAAKKIFDAQKASICILSGSRRAKGLNQAEEMKNILMKMGVVPEKFIIDENGSRTWYSLRFCVAQHISSLIIVSQHFHNARAAFIARFMGIQVQAFDAKGVKGWVKYKILLRERLARIRCLWDIFRHVTSEVAQKQFSSNKT